MKKKFFPCCLMLLISLLFSTCKKETVDKDYYPVQYPGSWFPVYPGSHWTYLYTHQDSLVPSTITWTTSSSYQVYRYPDGYGNYSGYFINSK